MDTSRRNLGKISIGLRLKGRRQFECLLFLMGMFFISSGLSAQNYLHLEKLVLDTEEMKTPISSENGEWLAWYVALGDGTKNVMVQSVKNSDKRMERKNVDFATFVKNYLAVQTGENVEYFDPKIGKSSYLKGVSKFIYNSAHDVLVVLSAERSGKKLEVFDTDLNLTQIVTDVQGIYRKDDEIIVNARNGNQNQILVLNNGNYEAIFSTLNEVKNVVPSGLREKGVVVHTVKEGQSVIYYIAQDKSQYMVDVSEYSDYEQMTLNSSHSDHRLVLKLEKLVRSKKEMVNIWYGTDFDLGEHEGAVVKFIQIDWEPFTGEKILMTQSGYFGETAIGNNLYLMNAIDKDQVDSMDKAAGNGFDKLYLWNALTNTHTMIADVQKQMVISPTGKYILLQKEKNWQLYNTATLKMEELNISEDVIPYFSSENDILWVGGNRIFEQNIVSRKIRNLYFLKDWDIELIDYGKIITEIAHQRNFRTADLKKSLVMKMTKVGSLEVSYAYLKNRKLYAIIASSPDEIKDLKRLGTGENFYWTEENYNKRPRLVAKIGSSGLKTVYISDSKDQKFEDAKLIRFSYNGADGRKVSGNLYMPLNYDRSKKYPVVTHIYERQDYLTKRFLRPSFSNPTGLNIALLMEEGFAVLLADVSQSDQGAGISAMESIDHALDELQKMENIDINRIGLMGQSFGGYQTNFIAAHSNRFAAYVSGASVSDVIRTYYAFNYNFKAPDYYRYEGGQFGFKTTVAENPEKYIKNNPIMYAQKVNVPMLLWTGSDDKNVSPEGTKAMFIALRKYRKPVIALFYDKERHSLGKSETQKDLTLKIIDWFNYHLKDQKNIPWIQKYIKGAE